MKAKGVTPPPLPGPSEKPIPFMGDMVRAIMRDASDGGQEPKTVTRRLFRLERAKVRVFKPVLADIPFNRCEPLAPGRLYKASINRYGAVSAWTRQRNHRMAVRTKWTPCLLGLRPDEFEWVSPWGAVGETMWVRETWADWEGGTCYRADGNWLDGVNAPGHPDVPAEIDRLKLWKPPMFMRRVDSRLDLRITGLKIMPLHDITEADARAEGVERCSMGWVGAPKPGSRPYHGKKNSYTIGRPFHVCATAVDAYREIWIGLYGQESWNANPWVWRIQFERVIPRERGWLLRDWEARQKGIVAGRTNP